MDFQLVAINQKIEKMKAKTAPGRHSVMRKSALRGMLIC